jgi:hypothetical protein
VHRFQIYINIYIYLERTDSHNHWDSHPLFSPSVVCNCCLQLLITRAGTTHNLQFIDAIFVHIPLAILVAHSIRGIAESFQSGTYYNCFFTQSLTFCSWHLHKYATISNLCNRHSSSNLIEQHIAWTLPRILFPGMVRNLRPTHSPPPDQAPPCCVPAFSSAA